MPVTYPNESKEYRLARDILLKEEVALRGHIERVAGLRRNLPAGGVMKENYEFVNLDGDNVAIADLFSANKDTLAIYSLMFKPDDQSACPMCASLLDGLNGQVAHFGQRLDFAVVAAATPAQLAGLANDRGWSNLRILSVQGNAYQTDYHAESPDGAQLPMINIFRKSPDGISHFWGSESFHADIGGHPRHLDQIWPLWNMFDLTPGGRGVDWYPSL